MTDTSEKFTLPIIILHQNFQDLKIITHSTAQQTKCLHTVFLHCVGKNFLLRKKTKTELISSAAVGYCTLQFAHQKKEKENNSKNFIGL